MGPDATSYPFGTRTRTRILLALSERPDAHIRKLARLIGASLSVVQHALATLERDGLVQVRTVGRVRRVSLNSDYPAHVELAALLRRLHAAEREALPGSADRPGTTDA